MKSRRQAIIAALLAPLGMGQRLFTGKRVLIYITDRDANGKVEVYDAMMEIHADGRKITLTAKEIMDALGATERD